MWLTTRFPKLQTPVGTLGSFCQRVVSLPGFFFGDVMAGATLLDRFNAKITVDKTGCWLWTACLNGAGYGRIRVNRKTLKAHRVSYELHKGPIPDGLFVCHSCDVPSCVNPDHLWLGTSQDNVDDCVRKGRQTRGEKIAQSKLTESDVKQIRSLYPKLSQYKLAAKFKVDQSAISDIITRESWSHVK